LCLLLSAVPILTLILFHYRRGVVVASWYGVCFFLSGEIDAPLDLQGATLQKAIPK